MTPTIVRPEAYPQELMRADVPVVFLAGPVKGAAKWRDEAIALLTEKAAERGIPSLGIATPERDGACPPFDHPSQVDWESTWLRRAANFGVLLFWLARESAHHCDRAYAQTTRFELAEWFARGEADGEEVSLVLGIEAGFSGAQYIRHRCASLSPCDSLGVVCDRSIESIDRQIRFRPAR